MSNEEKVIHKSCLLRFLKCSHWWLIFMKAFTYPQFVTTLQPQLNFYPHPAWGTPPSFFKLLSPAMHANFSSQLCIESTILGPFFLVVLVEKINSLINCIGFYCQKKSSFQGEIRPFTHNCLYESKLHGHMLYPQAKILPPSIF